MHKTMDLDFLVPIFKILHNIESSIHTATANQDYPRVKSTM